jgi:hypothetical protein
VHDEQPEESAVKKPRSERSGSSRAGATVGSLDVADVSTEDGRRRRLAELAKQLGTFEFLSPDELREMREED